MQQAIFKTYHTLTIHKGFKYEHIELRQYKYLKCLECATHPYHFDVAYLKNEFLCI